MIRVCCAIILKEYRILAVQRSITMTHPLKWEFPGGKVQNGESEEACILRELEEELHLPVLLLKKLSQVVHQYGDRQIELIPFVAATEKTPTLTEHSSLQWLTVSDLGKLDWVEADVKVIEVFNREWNT